MARPRRIDQTALLAAARTVFVRDGAGASTRAVAAEAGVSQAVLFQRYRTKTDLYFAAMLPRPPEVDALLGDVPEPGAAAARAHLHALADRVSAWLDRAMPGGVRAALHEDAPAALDRVHGPSGLDGLSRAIADRIAALRDRGDLRADSPDTAASALLALLHGAALTRLVSAGAMSDDVHGLVDILWSGLGSATSDACST